MTARRRTAATLLAAASLLAVPSTASATAPSAAVDTYRTSSGFAYFESVQDGVRTSASISEYTGGEDVRSREAYVSVQRFGPTGGTYVSGTVDTALVDFARNASTASAVEVPVTITTYTWSSYYQPETSQGVITISFQGVGDITRHASHQTMCGDGESECQSVRVESARAATASLTGAGLDAAGSGMIFLGLGIDAARFRPTQLPE